MTNTIRNAALAAAILAGTAGAAAAQDATRVTVNQAPNGGAPTVTIAPADHAAAAPSTPKETVAAAVKQYFPHLPAHVEQPLTFVVGADGQVIRAQRTPNGVDATVNPNTIQQVEVFKGTGGIPVDGRTVDVIWITLK